MKTQKVVLGFAIMFVASMMYFVSVSVPGWAAAAKMSKAPTGGKRRAMIVAKAPRPARPWYKVSVIPSGAPMSAFNDAGQGITVAVYGKPPHETLSAALWQNGKYIRLSVPAGASFIRAVALNDHGQVLVTAPHKVYVWSNGTYKSVPGLTGAGAINNHGDIAGQAFSSQMRPPNIIRAAEGHADHAFLRHDGSLEDLGAIPSKHNDSIAHAINDSCEVAGESGGHAFLWSQGKMRDLGSLPGYQTSNAIAINSRGQVAGSCNASEGMSGDAYQEPFLYDHGKLRDLGTLAGGNHTFVCGLDDSGDVVGKIAYVPNFNDRPDTPLLWHKGKLYDLNDLVPQRPGFGLAEPTAINKNGQIVCTGYANDQEKSGMSHGYVPRLYLLTPIKPSGSSGAR